MTAVPVSKNDHLKWRQDATEVWLHDEITDRVRFHVKRRNRTWGWLCAQTGISQTALNTRVGGSARWQVYEVYICADVLGVPLSALLPPLRDIQ